MYLPKILLELYYLPSSSWPPTLSQVLRKLVLSLFPTRPCLHTLSCFTHAIFPTTNISPLLHLSKSHPFSRNCYKAHLLYEISPIHSRPYSALLFSEFLKHLLDCIIIYNVSSVYVLFPMGL